MAEGFKIAEAFVEIIGDRSRLDRDIDNLPNTTKADAAGRKVGDKIVDGMDKGVREGIRKKVGPGVDREGGGLGDKLSQGMSMSLMRNSPLILAAIAAGLTAGAPLMLAAGTVLFAGIGVVAAAQSEKVQSAWLAAWGQIRDGAISDAEVIVPTLVGAADTIAAGFQRMRPQLRDAFADAAPAIDGFVMSVVDAAENALPGFTDAIERSGPVIKGMGDFLESTGTALGDFFSRLSEHSGASGQVFTQLGQTMETLLPILAELLGQGAELATQVLPLVNGALGILLGLLEHTGGALPALIAGFSAFRILGTVGGWVDNLGGRLVTLGTKNIPLVSTAAGKMGGALSTIGGAAAAGGAGVAALAAVIGILIAAHQSSEAKIRAWSQALTEGGHAATVAYQEMGNPSFWDKFIYNLGHWGNTQDVATAQMKDAEEQAKAYYDSLSPLGQAQADADKAQNELNEAVEKYGPGSAQASIAARDLASAHSRAAAMANEQEMALRGVTEAMIDQANQARSMVDAAFANEDALIGVTEATQAYAEAVKEHGRSSEEAAAALRDLQRSYSDAGQTANELAQSNLPAAVDDQTRAYYGARAELDYYQQLVAQGIDLPDWMDQQIALLERQVGGAAAAAAAQDILRTAIEEVGVAVTEVPGEKAVIITGEGTDELRTKLSDLGFAIERIPGTTDYKIIADDAQSEAALATLMGQLAGLDLTTAEPQVLLNGQVQLQTDIESITAQLLGLDGFVANPHVQTESDVGTQTDVDLDDLFGLDGTVATPQANLDSTDLQREHMNSMSSLSTLNAQHPIPIASLDNGLLILGYGNSMGLITNLASQLPTPKAKLDSSAFAGAYTTTMGQIGNLAQQRPTPTVAVNDQASGTISKIAAKLASLQDRTVTVTTVSKAAKAAMGGPLGDPIKRAGGGITSNGKVYGPGSTTSDSVGPFSTPTADAWLSNLEYVIKAASAQRYGDKKMAAVNAGTATVLLPNEVTEGLRSMFTGPQFTGPQQATATVSTRTRDVHVHVTGLFDLRDRNGMRALGVELRKVLAEIEREER